MAGRKPSSDLVGRWHIVSMTEWEEDYLNEEVQAFIELGPRQRGAFQFGYVRGEVDYRITQRDGKPAVEFSWDGNDEMDPAQGRGWAVLEGGELRGMIFCHLGDESGFAARPAREKQSREGK